MTDAALGIKALPIIRLPIVDHDQLVAEADQKGIILQAYVARCLMNRKSGEQRDALRRTRDTEATVRDRRPE